MSRLATVVIAVFVHGLAGCQTDADYIGTGPITLSAKTEAAYDKWKNGGIYFFVTDDGKGSYYVYCPVSSFGACQGGSWNAHLAKQECERRNNRRCRLFGLNDQRVWNGNVYYASKGGPPSGADDPRPLLRRSIAVSWEGYDNLFSGIVEERSHGRKGDVKIVLPKNEGECTGNYFATHSSGGWWNIICSNGLKASGDFTMYGAGKGASGSGKDAQGRRVTYTIGGVPSAEANQNADNSPTAVTEPSAQKRKNKISIRYDENGKLRYVVPEYVPNDTDVICQLPDSSQRYIHAVDCKRLGGKPISN